MTMAYCGVYTALEELARQETKNWDFATWYRDGVDWYLSREIIYLCLDWNDPDETGISFEKYTNGQLARMAREYPLEMDDFTRLWNSDQSKFEVLGEVKRWLEENCPEGKDEQVHT